MGIHNTHNESGGPCTDDNPCEVDGEGDETSLPGRAYGQRVHMIGACLTAGSALDLSRAECTLTPAA
ncbi:hypothetical protein [Nocardiopsis sp. CC223A]|uniref:hypothetical protein n=1 Tax=Nocardiopsis sp. CC223A TaxID=3044051 RepID=UPI00278C60C3|nr:hypothetical protein [Nocardiopsis sp. CC223A]